MAEFCAAMESCGDPGIERLSTLDEAVGWKVGSETHATFAVEMTVVWQSELWVTRGGLKVRERGLHPSTSWSLRDHRLGHRLFVARLDPTGLTAGEARWLADMEERLPEALESIASRTGVDWSPAERRLPLG